MSSREAKAGRNARRRVASGGCARRWRRLSSSQVSFASRAAPVDFCLSGKPSCNASVLAGQELECEVAGGQGSVRPRCAVAACAPPTGPAALLHLGAAAASALAPAASADWRAALALLSVLYEYSALSRGVRQGRISPGECAAASAPAWQLMGRDGIPSREAGGWGGEVQRCAGWPWDVRAGRPQRPRLTGVRRACEDARA